MNITEIYDYLRSQPAERIVNWMLRNMDLQHVEYCAMQLKSDDSRSRKRKLNCIYENVPQP